MRQSLKYGQKLQLKNDPLKRTFQAWDGFVMDNAEDDVVMAFGADGAVSVFKVSECTILNKEEAQ